MENKSKTIWERSFGTSNGRAVQCCILGKFQLGKQRSAFEDFPQIHRDVLLAPPAGMRRPASSAEPITLTEQ